MRKYMTAFSMTQSMFCSLPFPCKAWDEKCRSYMLLFLPVVGFEIGALWLLIDFVLKSFVSITAIYPYPQHAARILLSWSMVNPSTQSTSTFLPVNSMLPLPLSKLYSFIRFVALSV